MGVVQRGERQPKRRPVACGVALGIGAERGETTVQFDARAEQQRIALEGREAEDIAEPFQCGGLRARHLRRRGQGRSGWRLGATQVGAALGDVALQRGAYPFQGRHQVALVGAMPYRLRVRFLSCLSSLLRLRDYTHRGSPAHSLLHLFRLRCAGWDDGTTSAAARIRTDAR